MHSQTPNDLFTTLLHEGNLNQIPEFQSSAPLILIEATLTKYLLIVVNNDDDTNTVKTARKILENCLEYLLTHPLHSDKKEEFKDWIVTFCCIAIKQKHTIFKMLLELIGRHFDDHLQHLFLSSLIARVTQIACVEENKILCQEGLTKFIFKQLIEPNQHRLSAEDWVNCCNMIWRNAYFLKNLKRSHAALYPILELAVNTSSQAFQGDVKMKEYFQSMIIASGMPYRSLFQRSLKAPFNWMEQGNPYLGMNLPAGMHLPIERMTIRHGDTCLPMLNDYLILLTNEARINFLRKNKASLISYPFRRIHKYIEWNAGSTLHAFSSLPFYQDLIDGHFDAVKTVIKLQPELLQTIMRTASISELIQCCLSNRHFKAALFLLNEYVFLERDLNQQDKLNLNALLFFITEFYSYLCTHETFDEFLRTCFRCDPNLNARKKGDTLLHSFIKHYVVFDEPSQHVNEPLFLTLLFQYEKGADLINQKNDVGEFPLLTLCKQPFYFIPWFNAIVSRVTSLDQLNQSVDHYENNPITHASLQPNTADLTKALIALQSKLKKPEDQYAALVSTDFSVSQLVKLIQDYTPHLDTLDEIKLYSTVPHVIFRNEEVNESPLLTAFYSPYLDVAEFFLNDIILPNKKEILKMNSGFNLNDALFLLIEYFINNPTHRLNNNERLIIIIERMLENDLIDSADKPSMSNQKNENILHLLGKVKLTQKNIGSEMLQTKHAECFILILRTLLLFLSNPLLNQKNQQGKLPLHYFVERGDLRFLPTVLLFTTQEHIAQFRKDKTEEELKQFELALKQINDHEKRFAPSALLELYCIMHELFRSKEEAHCAAPHDIWLVIMYYTSMRDKRFGDTKFDKGIRSITYTPSLMIKCALDSKMFIEKVRECYNEFDNFSKKSFSSTSVYFSPQSYIAPYDKEFFSAIKAILDTEKTSPDEMAEQLKKVIEEFQNKPDSHQKKNTLQLLSKNALAEYVRNSVQFEAKNKL